VSERDVTNPPTRVGLPRERTVIGGSRIEV